MAEPDNYTGGAMKVWILTLLVSSYFGQNIHHYTDDSVYASKKRVRGGTCYASPLNANQGWSGLP